MRFGIGAGLCALVMASASAQAQAPRTLAAASTAGPPGAPDPRVLDELSQDLARFQEAVRGYRSATNVVIRRAYYDKIRSIKGKYEPLIAYNEREERERRLDAIAMFEGFLRKYPLDRRWTPDAMFRLAELYYEKSQDQFLFAQESYQKALDSATPPSGEPPRPDFGQTVDLYRRMLTEFPNYRLADAAYYLLGFCLSEMGQEAEGRQALLALTCANQHRAFDKPTEIKVSTGSAAQADPYKGCQPIRKDSKFLPEAWTRIGEVHFDNAELAPAISAYRKVLDFKDSSYYDKALYKLAWSYYRDNRFVEAIREFDNLVKWADARKASGDKFGSDLRPEAIQYLGVSFSEPDWNGDSAPDAETGLQRVQAFYQGREEEPHVKEVYQRLGEIYFDATQYPESIAAFKALLARWPYYPDAPKIQDRIVQAYERDRNLVAAAQERELLGKTYAKGSAWYNQNQNNPDALSAAQQLAEDALLTAATNVHSGAQACRPEALASKNPAKMEECKALYRTSADLYEKYLTAYPNAKRAYEYSIYYADALFYSEQYDRAVGAYMTVRDSVLDNRFQRDAALNVIYAYEEMIERMKTAGQLQDPPLPSEENTSPPVSPVPLPDIYQKYQAALDWYVNNVKDERVPEMRYAAATLNLRFKQWPEARQRLDQVADTYCATQPEVGFKAYGALIGTYFIDAKIQDEEQYDCALGRLLTLVDKFAQSPCSKNPGAAPFLTRVQEIRTSVRSKIISKRLALAIENEEKGTDRQLVVCREGPGAIAMVTGYQAPTTAGGQPTTPAAGAAPAGGKVSTEMDVGLALDLIDLVNQNPRDADAPKNLNNACLIHEKLFQYGEATRCYERLATDYPDSNEGKDAVWNAAKSNERFFNFDAAVAGYLKIADEPRFANHEHRRDALGGAATLLDNDQQYAQAATLYRRYADATGDKPRDSAQSFLFSCNAHEKANDLGKQRQCLNDLTRRYGSQPEAGEYVVESYLKLAALSDRGGDRAATQRAYQKVRDEFINRRLPAPSPAAAAAAKAEFLLVEDKFNAFKNKPFKVTDSKRAASTLQSFMNEAKGLQQEYQKVWDYKDATWTLASFLRRGDIFYEFAQKLLKAADSPPDDIKAISRKACRADPSLCGVAETEYKDGILQYVSQVEEVAKNEWKATLERASQLGVTNEYVKKARENLSKYLPDEFPFVKDERPQREEP
ncbi:MAG TPA: tetratricopeptide repeat protein [Polyangia bacterium]